MIPFVLWTFCLTAQYVTPGTGVIWNMDSLVANSNGVVSLLNFSTQLSINEDLIIAENDSISIVANIVGVNNDVTIFVDGDLYIENSQLFPNEVIPGDEYGYFQGIRMEETAEVYIVGSLFHGCGGMKVLTPNFTLNDCHFSYNQAAGLTSGGLIEISTGKPQIIYNFFDGTINSAISSAANASVAPVIIGNFFDNCVMSNTNRPAVNLGPSGVDTTIFSNNWVEGMIQNEMAGALAFSSLVGGEGNIEIENNVFLGNRYGIAIIGNGLYALINNNNIFDNAIQEDPFLGGSGINLNGNNTSFALISNNNISGNHWGVTIQGEFLANLGDIFGANIDSPGGNYFSDNGNNGQLYALFNNTPNDVSALHNCWTDISETNTLELAETVISHRLDDPTLGEVFFDPMAEDCNPSGINELNLSEQIDLFPNPVATNFQMQWHESLRPLSYKIYTISGKEILTETIGNFSSIEIDTKNFQPGYYTIVIAFEEGSAVKKFIKNP